MIAIPFIIRGGISVSMGPVHLHLWIFIFYKEWYYRTSEMVLFYLVSEFLTGIPALLISGFEMLSAISIVTYN